MFKQKGFTLIELMVAIVILLCFVMVIVGAGVGASNSNSNISIGINGMMETRCVEGYKFIVDQNGNTRQILDEFGKGARCETNSKPGGF